MTPKEKAEELVDKMYYSRKYKDGEDYIPEQALIHAKQCALITVDEILFEITDEDDISWFKKVKQEIEKL